MEKNFSKKEWITLLIIPIELLLGWLINLVGLTKNQLLSVILVFFIFLSGFLLAVTLNKELLKTEFTEYKKHLFKNILLSLGGAVMFGVIMFGGRAVLSESQTTMSGSIGADFFATTFIPTLIGAVIPLMAPFTEELVFRHLLFFKWVNKRHTAILMAVVSSILFGFAHYNNYATVPLLMLPLMVSGLLLAGLYYWKQNIWFSIFAHFIYNAVFSVVPAIFLIIIQLMNGG